MKQSLDSEKSQRQAGHADRDIAVGKQLDVNSGMPLS
jgi:hypothetical protein